jgi:methylmalonyl-CoA/ethylmalonyl-CoA epimerase
MSAVTQNSRLHHVGYVVPSISGSVAEYQAALSLGWDGEIVHDPLQMVRVTFLPSNSPETATVELVEPAGPRSPVRKFADAGGGIHHVCYEVDDLKTHLESAQHAGCILVRVPLAAAAFGGRKIAWVKTGTGQLVEFLQR